MTDEIVDGEPVFTVVPYTGEALTLRDMPMEQIALALEQAREFEFVGLRSFKRELQDEILRRMDARASWTAHEGGYKLTGDSPAPTEAWDGAQLREALLNLVDEGLLTIQAVDAAVETVVTYKPRKRGIDQLRKLGGRVCEVVNDARTLTERERRVSVGRAS